jgi:predicted metal-dependent HD superfamily phosphohydrolase
VIRSEPCSVAEVDASLGSVLNQQRWTQLWSRLGAQGNSEPIFAQLTAAYGQPGRAYHNAEHIQDCLSELDDSHTLADHPDSIEAALWFHDAVYVPGAADNEKKSAELARRALTGARVPRDTVETIARLVLVTRHVSLPAKMDEQLICDIDLAVLGRAPEHFAEFEAKIRREYAWVPEPVYRRERSVVLAGFLRRPSIYQTDQFRARYEARARENLRHLVEQLSTS